VSNFNSSQTEFLWPVPKIHLDEKFGRREGKPLREVWHPPESVLTNKCGYACGEMREELG